MIIAGIFILTFFILRPIILAIIFGLLCAYIFNPIYRRIKRYVPGRNLSAFVFITLLTIVVVIPLVYVVPLLVRQTFDTFVLLQNFDMADYLGNFIKGDLAGTIAVHLDNIIGKTFSSLLGQLTNILVNLPSLLLQSAVFLFTFFFAIRDSEELKKYITTLSPFSVENEKKFMREFRGITNAIIFGQVLIGIIQGLALGAGLFFLGVPNVLVLTFVACIVSIIPVLGSWLVWFPVGIFLLISSQTFAGVFLLLYGALFVSTIDNILRPYILSKQSNLPVVLSVIGTIGGLYLFGIAGLILGPLILAYLLIIIEFYQQGKLNELFSK